MGTIYAQSHLTQTNQGLFSDQGDIKCSLYVEKMQRWNHTELPNSQVIYRPRQALAECMETSTGDICTHTDEWGSQRGEEGFRLPFRYVGYTLSVSYLWLSWILKYLLNRCQEQLFLAFSSTELSSWGQHQRNTDSIEVPISKNTRMTTNMSCCLYDHRSITKAYTVKLVR